MPEDAVWQDTASCWTNAGSYAVWYRVSAANCKDYVHEARVVITQKPLAEEMVGAIGDVVYNGAAWRPEVTVTDGTPSIITADDWTVGYADNVDVGTASVTITATEEGNYSGEMVKTFRILPRGMTGSGFAGTLAETAFVYDGTAHTPAVSVTDGAAALVENRDFTVVYEDNIDAGTGYAVVTGTGNYAGEMRLAFEIAKRPITLTATSKDKPYDGFPLAVTAGDITASGSGYAKDECFTYGGFASITDVGETAATFTYGDSATAKVSNYAVTVVGGKTLTVTVGTDQISVTAASGCWEYDGTAHTRAEWSVVNGDKLLDGMVFEIKISDASVITTPGAVSNKFEYVRIVETATGIDRTRNYNLFVYEGELRVTNAAVTPGRLTAGGGSFDVTKVYDGAAVSAPIRADGLLTAATIRYGLAADDISRATNPAFVHAGVYEVWYEIRAPYYDVYTNVAQVAIARRPVTLTSPTRAKPYDGTALTFVANDITAENLASDDGLVFSNFASITDAGRIASSFDYDAADGTSLDDYAVTVNTGTLTVLASAEEISVTAKSRTWAYDGAAHTLAAYDVENADVLRPGDELEVTFDAASCVTTPDEGAVENRIVSVRVLRGGTEDVTRNYSLATYPGTLRVANARVDFAALGIDAAAFSTEAVYDGCGHTVAVTAPELLTGPATVMFAAEADGAWRDTPPAFTNAGTYTTHYAISGKYYDTLFGTATVTITPREVTLCSAGATKTYDGTPLRAERVTVKEGSLDFAEGDTFAAGSFASITDVGGTENAFDYTLTGKSLAGNYIIHKEFGWLRVTPAEMNLANVARPYAGVYDGAGHGIEVVSDLPGAVITYALVAGDESAYSEENPVWTNATDGAVTVYFKIMAPNYNPGYGAATVEIGKRAITLRSDDGEWTYDGVAHAAEAVEIGGDGLVEGETLGFAGFPEVCHVADAREPVENVFEVLFAGDADGATAKRGNYVVRTAFGTVRMIRRPITLTAPTKTQAYNGTALTFGADEIAVGGAGFTENESFVFGGFASITETGQTAATFSVGDGTALLDDYAVTVTPGATLTVTKSAAEITVTAESGSWVYDGGEHVLHSYRTTNEGTLLAGDRLEVAFAEESRVTTPSDGTVENRIVSVRVMRGELDVSANYTLAWYSGGLAVTKRPVTLASKSARKTYDGTELTLHEVDVGGDGFVGEDGATYDFAGTQTEAGTSANTFSYTLKEGVNAACYAITTVEGELTVEPADISSGTDADWEIVLGPSLTYNGLVQLQTVASATFRGLSVDCAVSGNQQTDAGDYELELVGQGNFCGRKSVAWTLNPKALTLTAGSGSKTYDGAPLAVANVTAQGFVSGEGAAYTCRGAQLDVGSCANEVESVNWTNAKATNYIVTKKSGTLTVTARPVTVTSRNIGKPYDGTPLSLTAADISADNLVSGESFVYGGFASRTEAGQTAATFSVAAGAGTKLENYIVTPVYGMITIAKSAAEIGVTAESRTWEYDGETHLLHEYETVNESILLAGDRLEVEFAEESRVTTPSDGTVENRIVSVRVMRGDRDVTDNYTVTHYPGTLAVTKRKVTVEVKGRSATAVYDGAAHTVEGYEISTADDLYDIDGRTSFGGTANVSRTDVGRSEMGLAAADFVNSDDNFEVTYAVADGWVEIEAADISACEDGDFVIELGENPKYNGTPQTVEVKSVTCRGLAVTYTLAGENSTHAGTFVLTVKAGGNFTGERSTTWSILKRRVVMTSGSASRAYNGQPLRNDSVTVSGDGFIGSEGAAFTVTGSQTVEGASKNTFVYELKAGTQEGDYDISRIEGDLVVTKAGSPFAGGQEPDVPGEGMVSAFDYAGEYDGKGHTIDTNALVAAVRKIAIAGAECKISYWIPRFEKSLSQLGADSESGEPRITNALSQLGAVPEDAVWQDTAPCFTNAGRYAVWYRVSAANCADYVHEARVTITKKPLAVEMVGDVADVVYNGAAWKPEVTVTDGEPSIITADDWTVSYLDNTSAGTAKVVVTAMEDGNYSGEVVKTFAIGKIKIEPPEIASKVYTGEAQTADVAETDYYRVANNRGGTGAGTYTVMLMLKDAKNHEWTTVGTSYVLLNFVITPAENVWTVEPSIDGWKEGAAASRPQGAARFGEVSVLYSGTANNGTVYENALQVANAGSYRAVFTVAESPNYNGLRCEVPFVISAAASEESEPFSFRVVNYAGVADGKSHTIQVITTGGDGSFTVEYSATGDDPWLAEAPTYSEPCATQVWYRITSPNYAPVYGSGTVSISAAGNTGGNGVTVTPPDAASFVIPDSWFTEYPAFESLFGADKNAAVLKETGKRDAAGNEMKVWHDYVAGTDPTKPDSRLRASIMLEDGMPVVDWKPALNGERVREGVRRYRVFGANEEDLKRANWTEVPAGKEGDYHFFKVTVEMP